MFGRFFRAFAHEQRPEINSQNTGRLALERVTGLTLVPSNGGAGIAVRSDRATNPASLMLGPTHKLNDPTVTGNVSSSPELEALSDPLGNIIGSISGNL